jgi:hypothetical protein
MKLQLTAVTFTLFAMQRSAAFVARKSFIATQQRAASTSAFRGTSTMFAEEGQAEVVLVGCGAPNRGMGWYHAIQMLEKK